jgi:hypothetical protein
MPFVPMYVSTPCRYPSRMSCVACRVVTLPVMLLVQPVQIMRTEAAKGRSNRQFISFYSMHRHSCCSSVQDCSVFVCSVPLCRAPKEPEESVSGTCSLHIHDTTAPLQAW